MTAKQPVYGCVLVGIVAVAAKPLLAQNSGSAVVSLNKGLEAFKEASTTGDYRAARRHFEAAIRDQPDFAAAHYFLGLTFLQTASAASDPTERDQLLEWAVAEFERSRVDDPELVLAYLDAAIADIILGKFEQAESGLHRFIESRPDDPLPYLFLAVVHYREGRDGTSDFTKALENLDRAQAALDRATKKPAMTAAYIQFYRGAIYIKQRDPRRAADALQAVHELAPGTDVAEKAKDLLERVRRGELARRNWDLALQLGLDWDSNVVLRGKRTSQMFRDNDDEDWRFGLGSAFAYRFVDRDDLVFGAGVNTFHSWHTDIDEFNVQTYGWSLFAGYTPAGADHISLGLRYDGDQSLLGNDLYLQRHRITPQLILRETDWTASTLFYQYDNRDYHFDLTDPRLDRDSDINAVGVVQDFELAQMFDRPLMASLGYRFENFSTDGSEFDSDNHVFTLGIDVPLPEDITFGFLTEWELQRYEHGSLFDAEGSKRRDNIHTLIFALTKRFNEQLSARLHMEFTKDDSNVKDSAGRQFFSYDRAIYGISVLYQF
jgi:hypothetical protein